MKITSLEVKNYRTLENINLMLSDGYNAVCGKNNSGKSNLFKAIRTIGNPYTLYIDYSPYILIF